MIQILDKAPAPFKGTEVHTLDNGLRLIIKEDHTVPVVAIQAWARCGAIDEAPRVYGISHGLEHMVFKGTNKRSAGEITQAIESQGGVMNAATQLETTHYYIEIPSYGATQAVEVLADTILDPTFPEVELERERLVILEEIRSRDDSPDATLWDEFVSDVFKDTPYAIKVIGSEKTVSALSQKDLSDYYRTFYAPENKCIVVVGDFDKKKMVDQLTRLFQSEKARSAPKAPTVQVNGYTASQRVIKKPVQMAHVAMGFPTIGLFHDDAMALDVFTDVIGGGISSRLYQKVREELQLVLSVSCDYIPFQQKGLFAFFFETLTEKADDAQKRLEDELNAIKANPIRPDEMARAKARIKSEWLHASEAPRGQASTLGSLTILGHLNVLDGYLEKINALTIDDLMRVYEQHLYGKKYIVTHVRP